MTDNEIILEALNQYEENNYQGQGKKWQKQVNGLITKYKFKVLEDVYN